MEANGSCHAPCNALRQKNITKEVETVTREFLKKVCDLGLYKTRKHYYKRIVTNDYIKVIRDNRVVIAVWAR